MIPHAIAHRPGRTLCNPVFTFKEQLHQVCKFLFIVADIGHHLAALSFGVFVEEGLFQIHVNSTWYKVQRFRFEVQRHLLAVEVSVALSCLFVWSTKTEASNSMAQIEIEGSDVIAWEVFWKCEIPSCVTAPI